MPYWVFFFFQAEDGIRDKLVTGVQTCALPIWSRPAHTRDDGVSVHIQPAASLDQLVHHAASCQKCGRDPEELPSTHDSARRARTRQCGVPKAPTSDSLRTRSYQDSATLPEPRPANGS